MSGEENNRVMKFEGTDFRVWKTRIFGLLDYHDLLSMVTEDVPKTVTADYKRKNARAKHLIMQNIHNSHLSYCEDYDYAKDIIDVLERTFASDDLETQMFLRKKLYTLKIGSTPVEKHIMNFDSILRDLRTAGATVSDFESVSMLLLTFSEAKEYQTQVQIIESKPKKELKLISVKQKLLQHGQRLINNDPVKPEGDAAAMVTNKVKIICRKCNKPGHVAKYCRFGNNGNSNFKNQNNNGNSNFGNRNGGNFNRFNNNNNRGNFDNNRSNFNRNNGNFNPNYDRNGGNYNNGNRGRGPVNCYQCGGVGHISKYCRNTNSSNDQSMNNNNNVKCFNCNAIGHIAKFCTKNLQVNCAEADQGPQVAFLTISDKHEDDKTMNDCTSEEIEFLLDSGAADHLVNKIEYLSDVTDLKIPVKFKVAKQDHVIEATKVGKVKFKLKNGAKDEYGEIVNVYYVPELDRNLLSVGSITDNNFKVNFFRRFAIIDNEKGQRVASAFRDGKLYKLRLRVINKFVGSSDRCHESELWHKRLAHLNYFDLGKLKDQLNLSNVDRTFCEPCVHGKQSRESFYRNDKRATQVLELVHSDVVGPITPTSYDNKTYIVTFLDDYSHFLMVYFMKNKSEVFDKFKEYYNLVTNMFSCKIRNFRCDNGGEYISNNFKDFCKEKGVMLQYSLPYRPQQNGRAERINRTIIERARTVLLESKLLSEFWTEAVYYAVYAINRSPTVNGIIPSELWFNKEVDYSNLRIFGCEAHMLKNRVDSKFRFKE